MACARHGQFEIKVCLMTTLTGHPLEPVLRAQAQELDDYLEELRCETEPDSVERAVLVARTAQLLEHYRTPADAPDGTGD